MHLDILETAAARYPEARDKLVCRMQKSKAKAVQNKSVQDIRWRFTWGVRVSGGEYRPL